MLTILFMRLAAAWNTLKPFEIACHRAENKRAWEEYILSKKRGYIEDQDELESLRYGHATFSFITRRTVGEQSLNPDGSIKCSANACQIAAIYNVLLALEGRSCPGLYEIIEEFEKKGAVMNACMGSSLTAGRDYLRRRGYRADQRGTGLLNKEDYDNLQRDYDAFIFVSCNDRRSVLKGLHVMSITKEPQGLTVHNRPGSGSYESLQEAVLSYRNGESRPLGIIGIRKRTAGADPDGSKQV